MATTQGLKFCSYLSALLLFATINVSSPLAETEAPQELTPPAPQAVAPEPAPVAPAPAPVAPAPVTIVETAPAAPVVAQPAPAPAPVVPPAAPEKKAEVKEKPAKEEDIKDEEAVDFSSDETFVDRSDALRSRNYVHRAILSSVIKNTSRFSVKRPYINHLMGFSNIWQRGEDNSAKYVTGLQGISVGYVSEKGHAFEGGVEFSNVSNAFVGYRYLLRPTGFSVWPFSGLGVGMEVKSLSLGDGPQEAREYAGQDKMGFITIGFLIPLVDVGLKAEGRINFYGADRWVLTQGIGVVIFL